MTASPASHASPPTRRVSPWRRTRLGRRFYRARGTVLVLVLGIILVLSAVIAAYLDIARKEIILRGMYFGRENMRLVAYSAFESTIGVLNTYLQLDGGLYGPAQFNGGLSGNLANPVDDKAPAPGWNNILAQAPDFVPPVGMTVTVSITDLTGLLPINRMSDIEFQAMLEVMGIQSPQSDELLDCFRDWTQPYNTSGATRLNGAGKDYYEALDPPYDPTYTAITNFDEFHYIKNWNTLFWDENHIETPAYQMFRKMVTLHDSGGATNINTAPPEVLQVLADQLLLEIDGTAVPTYLAGQDGIIGTQDDMLVRNSDEMTTAGVISTTGTSGNSTTGATTGTTGTGTAAGAGGVTAMAVGGGSPTTGSGGRGNAPAGTGSPTTGGGGRGNAPAGTGSPTTGGGRGGATGNPTTGGGRGGATGGTGGATTGGGTVGGGTAVGGGTTGGTGTAAGGTGTGTGGTSSATTANVGVGFLCRLLKINITVSMGEAHFLLSTIVQPNNYGTGVPSTASAGGASGSSTTNTIGADGSFTPTVNNISGAFPFKIVAIGENYDIP